MKHKTLPQALVCPNCNVFNAIKTINNSTEKHYSNGITTVETSFKEETLNPGDWVSFLCPSCSKEYILESWLNNTPAIVEEPINAFDVEKKINPPKVKELSPDAFLEKMSKLV